MHRNTYLVVSILAVLAALVIGVNVGKKLPASTTLAPTPTPSTNPAITFAPTPKMKTFTDSLCGFLVNYPPTLTAMENASGSAILQNANDVSAENIVITCQKGIPRPALPSDKIESLSLSVSDGSSVSAKLYHDQSAKDGSPIDAVIFTHPTNKLDVFIAGYGADFNALIKTIQVIR